MEDIEKSIMDLIAFGGAARSKALEAIRSSSEGNVESAKDKLEEAKILVGKAHNIQTELIVNESSGSNMQVSLLMVHAQDHLMNAMTIIDIAQDLIVLYDRISKKF